MKRLILSSILFFLFTMAYSQDHKSDVKKQFLTYYQLIIDKKFEQAMDYVNVNMFSLVPKKQLIEVMEKSFNSPEAEIHTDLPKNIVVSGKTQKGKEYFSTINYTADMKIRFKKLEDKANKDRSEVDRIMVRAQLEETFGKKNVVYDSTSGFFKIHAIKKAVANSTDLKKWTFVTVEPKQIPVLEKFIPKELLKQAK